MKSLCCNLAAAVHRQTLLGGSGAYWVKIPNEKLFPSLEGLPLCTIVNLEILQEKVLKRCDALAFSCDDALECGLAPLGFDGSFPL